MKKGFLLKFITISTENLLNNQKNATFRSKLEVEKKKCCIISISYHSHPEASANPTLLSNLCLYEANIVFVLFDNNIF
jgi:hypothetical protein